MGENPHIITIVVTAVATLLTALSIPKLYEMIIASKKIDSDSACKQRINELELELSQIRTGVDMMLTIIESEFDDKSSYTLAIHKVKELIKKVPKNGKTLPTRPE